MCEKPALKKIFLADQLCPLPGLPMGRPLD